MLIPFPIVGLQASFQNFLDWISVYINFSLSIPVLKFQILLLVYTPVAISILTQPLLNKESALNNFLWASQGGSNPRLFELQIKTLTTRPAKHSSLTLS